MIDSLFLAWKYLNYNKLRSATLIACITLISFLPASLNLLLDESELQLMSRAESTPLVVGAKGSALDLMMNTLYFGDEVPQIISMEAVEQVKDSDLAFPIPMYVRFKARGTPIIGTTLDYFEFRRLSIAQGRQLIMLGECVLGALAAKKLGLGPGDHLVSSPENLFDLAGVYPLKMKVTGILQVSHTPDDLAIFVDIKTAWIIQGLMHGHQDVTKTRDKSVILKKKEGNVTANAKLFQYMEITKDNIGSFHFHGDPAGYPLTAVVAVPYDEKSGTILRGRYLLEDKKKYQIVKPRDVIEGLLQNIFRIKNVLDAVILIVGCATILAIILVFALSLRLREQEIQTIFKLGCGRLTIARLLGAEIFIIVAASSFFCAIFVTIINLFSNDLVRMMFIQ
jgi:putative ABC transport system permease protein